jgi:hypothetical protein
MTRAMLRYPCRRGATLCLGILLAGLPAGLAMADAAAPAAPYAGLESRAIKTLSPAEIADLRAGRGIGFALAAELNGWPGPLHALELADALALSAGQRARLGHLLQAMRAETIPLGERVIAAEAARDRLFAERRATPEAVAAATAEAGAAQAALRAAHLRYHLEAAALLSPEQTERYAVLRGYRGGASAPPPAHRGGGHRH